MVDIRPGRRELQNGLSQVNFCSSTVSPVRIGERQMPPANVVQMSICSAMLKASSSSTPRYLTVLSTFVCPSSS